MSTLSRPGLPRLAAVAGDIAEARAEAIVNAANNHFWMGGGVAGALKRHGGAEIETEAVSLGPVEPGLAVTTSAGRLAARHVIHAAVMGQDLTTSPDLIARATASALAEAARLRLDSVAFPALGTGVGGFPLDQCARLMVTAVKAHSRAHAYPLSVTFVLRDEPARATFAAALESAAES
jgi:O-acetyl-ADP-ribose deacetylase (regulator of RNase III)